MLKLGGLQSGLHHINLVDLQASASARMFLNCGVGLSPGSVAPALQIITSQGPKAASAFRTAPCTCMAVECANQLSDVGDYTPSGSPVQTE